MFWDSFLRINGAHCVASERAVDRPTHTPGGGAPRESSTTHSIEWAYFYYSRYGDQLQSKVSKRKMKLEVMSRV